MKQLFLILVVATCILSCTTNDEDSISLTSNKTSVTNEIKEDVQENANQVNQLLLEKLIGKTRGINGEKKYPEFYGGSVVNDDGSLTILFTGDSATSVKAIKNMVNSNLLNFKRCLFSYQKLNNLMTFLNKKCLTLEFKFEN